MENQRPCGTRVVEGEWDLIINLVKEHRRKRELKKNEKGERERERRRRKKKMRRGSDQVDTQSSD